jgi:hypothetical protein
MACSLARQSAIKYELDELSACKALLDQCLQDDPQTIINYAAISFKEVRHAPHCLAVPRGLPLRGGKGPATPLTIRPSRQAGQCP